LRDFSSPAEWASVSRAHSHLLRVLSPSWAAFRVVAALVVSCRLSPPSSCSFVARYSLPRSVRCRRGRFALVCAVVVMPCVRLGASLRCSPYLIHFRVLSLRFPSSVGVRHSFIFLSLFPFRVHSRKKKKERFHLAHLSVISVCPSSVSRWLTHGSRETKNRVTGFIRIFPMSLSSGRFPQVWKPHTRPRGTEELTKAPQIPA